MTAITDYLQKTIQTIQKLSPEAIEAFQNQLLKTYEAGGTVFIFGNGGSAATASHFAGDFVKGVSFGLKKRFKVICLNDNNAAMMAIANDISYDAIFIEQLKNFLSSDDFVIGISGSGNSENVVCALEYAKGSGVATAAMCGFKGGRIAEIADVVLHAEINDMEVTEDIHMILTHCVKQCVRKALNPDAGCGSGSLYDARVTE